MIKFKFVMPILLLGILVLTGFGCEKSPEAFYTKFCKVTIDFQEEAEDIFENYSPGEEYDDVDECVEDLVEEEEDLYEECMDEEDDEDLCGEAINYRRETISGMFTQQGCRSVFGFYCGMPIPGMMEDFDVEDFNECMADLGDLCDSMPKRF